MERQVECIVSFRNGDNRVTVRYLLPKSFVPDTLTDIRPGVDRYIKCNLARTLGEDLYKNPRHIDPASLSISKAS